jgi:hypothetical protein
MPFTSIDGEFKLFRKGEIHDAHILENSILKIHSLAFFDCGTDSARHRDAAGKGC